MNKMIEKRRIRNIINEEMRYIATCVYCEMSFPSYFTKCPYCDNTQCDIGG